MMNCASCNAHNKDSAKFCNQCGCKLGETIPLAIVNPETKYCPHCGCNSDGNKFCKKCGHVFAKALLPDAIHLAPQRVVLAPAPLPAAEPEPTHQTISTAVPLQQVTDSTSSRNLRLIWIISAIFVVLMAVGAAAYLFWKPQSPESKQQLEISQEAKPAAPMPASEAEVQLPEEVIEFPGQGPNEPTTAPMRQSAPVDQAKNKVIPGTTVEPNKPPSNVKKMPSLQNSSRCTTLLQKASTGEPLSAVEQKEMVTLCQ